MDSTRNYPIRLGDRVFARVMMHGTTICELTLDRVASYTEVIGEVRHYLHDTKGLATIVVRNYHRGWSIESPLMLYGRFPVPTRRIRRPQSTANASAPAGRMLMPWETH